MTVPRQARDTTPMPSAALAMFVKFPEPGRVKTRLAATIGADGAAAIYRAFTDRLVQRHGNAGYALELCFTPPERAAEFAAAYPGVPLLPQVGATLGDRLDNAFAELGRRYDKVVVVGSDTPDLEPEAIERALASLDDHDVALGPCPDGGYYLVGMKARHDLFSDIEWSTSSVLDATLAHVDRLGLRCATMELRVDIDTEDELNGFLGRAGPADAALCREIEAELNRSRPSEDN